MLASQMLQIKSTGKECGKSSGNKYGKTSNQS
jgi:hypothetical protein